MIPELYDTQDGNNFHYFSRVRGAVTGWAIFMVFFPLSTLADVAAVVPDCACSVQPFGSGPGELMRIAEVLSGPDLQFREADCYSSLTADDRQMIQTLASRISRACEKASTTGEMESCQQVARQDWIDTLRDYKNRNGGAAHDRVLTAINTALQERHFNELKLELSRPGLAAPFNKFSGSLNDFHRSLDSASYQETRTRLDGNRDTSLWGRARRYTSMYFDRQFDYWLPSSTLDRNRFTQLKKSQLAFSQAHQELKNHISNLDVPAAKRFYLLDEVDAAVRVTNAKIVDANQEFEETRIGYLRTSGLTLLSVAAVGAAIPAISTMVGTGVGASGTSATTGVLYGAAAGGAGTAGSLGVRAVVSSTLGAQAEADHKQSRFFCELTRRKSAMGADLVSEGWRQVSISMIMGTGIGGALAVLGKLSPNAAALLAVGMGVGTVGKEVHAEWRRETAHGDRQEKLDILAKQSSPENQGKVIDAQFESARADAKDWTARAEAAADLAPLVIGGIHGLLQPREKAPLPPREPVDVAKATWLELMKNPKDPLFLSRSKKLPHQHQARTEELARRLALLEKLLAQIHPENTKKASEMFRSAANDPSYFQRLVDHLQNKTQAQKVISEMKKTATRMASESRAKLATALAESAQRSGQINTKYDILLLREQEIAYKPSIEELRKSFGEIDATLLKSGLKKPEGVFIGLVDDGRHSVSSIFQNYILVGHPQVERHRSMNRGLVTDGLEAADHEYGHTIFSYNLRRYQDGQIKGMHKFKDTSRLWGRAQDIYSAEYRSRVHMFEMLGSLKSEWAQKKSPTLSDRFQYLAKMIEIRLSNWRTTNKFARGKLTSKEQGELNLVGELSIPYQEVFADIVAVSKRGEQRALGETLRSFGGKPHGRDFGKHFTRATPLNRKTPNQEVHHSLDSIRNLLWNRYFSDPRNKGNHSVMLDRLHTVMADEIFSRAADPKLHAMSDGEATRRLSRKIKKALTDFDLKPKQIPLDQSP
jgi:hypothetical protein